MLHRYSQIAVFCALLTVFAKAMKIENADRNTQENITELTDSRSSILRHLADKNEEKPTAVNFAAEEFSLRPPDPCQCSAHDVEQALAPFNRPEPPFLPAYRGGKAQTITLPDQITDSAACRHADGTSVCGRPSYKFTDPESRLQITTFPHQGIIWDAQNNQVILHPQSTDPTGPHKVLITAYLPRFKEVLETAEISFYVHPEPENQLQNEERPEPIDMGQPIRILSPGQGFCTNPITIFNLFNTAALAEQKSFHTNGSQTALTGCDRELMTIDRATYAQNNLQRVYSAMGGSPTNLTWYKITLPSLTSITTILVVINGDDCAGAYIQNHRATFGNNSDAKLNAICQAQGAMTDGGWYKCPNSMTGTVFGILADWPYLCFNEVMAYSEDAIQINAGVTVSVLGTNTAPNLASNAIQNKFVLKADINGRSKCVVITPPSGGLATFKMKLPGQYWIKFVVLIPGYILSASSWATHQTNVAIYANSVGGTQQLCGILANYYTTYSETVCNFQANEIILVQQSAANSLRFCGFGAFQSCNCSQSSFDPARLTTRQKPFVSITSLQIKPSDGVQTIQFTQIIDTVSSSNGCASCGPRLYSFKDKLNDLVISQWPYRGYSFDEITFKLTLDPTQADATSVLTATISLQNYPTISMSQDITVLVEIVAQAPSSPTLQIPPMTLITIINQQASLQLPTLDASYVYSMVSKPTFQASIDGTQLQVFSTNENDVGTKYLDLVVTSPTNNATFRVKVIFTSTLSSATTTTSSSETTTTSSSATTTTTSVQTSAVTKPSVVSQSADNSESSLNELINQLEQVKCDEQGACVHPTNSRFTCYFDEEAGKFVCGVDLQKKKTLTANSVNKKASTQVQRPPVMAVSEVSRKGTLILSFNQPMNFSSLDNETYFEAQPSKKSKNSTKSIDFYKCRYLLSEKHLKITFLPDPDQDASKLEFTWFASNITEDTITIQFLFKHPTYISSIDGPNYLSVKLLPGFLVVKAKQSQMNIINPLRTEKRTVPSQLVLGTVTDNVEAASDNLKNVSEAGIIGNFFLSAIMKAAMGAIYTMICTFQMTMVYSFMVVSMPSNVNLVMTQMYMVASFDYLPSEKIMQLCFDFSKTVMPLVAFQQFGILSLRVTLFLGTFLIASVGVCLLSIVYLINWPFTRKFKLSFRYKKMMRTIYYWRGIIRLIIQSYWDLCLGILFSWQEPRFDKPSDIFDFIMTLFFTLVVVAGPLTFYLLLRKYAQELDNEQFQGRYGSLTDGLKTTGVLGSASTVKMTVWFFVRRFLTALVIVYLGNSSQIFQIALIMYLALYDVSMNFHLNAYQSKLNDIVDKINKIIVFLLSYFPFLYAGIIQDTELIYKIGWVQCALVGIMYTINMTVVFVSTSIRSMEEIRRVKVERFNSRMVKKYSKDFKVMAQSNWQMLSRVLQIEWAFFDGAPPRINEQIAAQVEMLRFSLNWGSLNKMPQGAQIDFDIELFRIQQAEIVGDQIDEFEMVSAYQAEDLVDQISEFSFYQNQAEEQKISSDNEQRVFNQEIKMAAKERIQISSEQSSREVQADQIVEDINLNAQLQTKLELRRQPEEIKQTPTQVAHHDWETELCQESDRPTVANKHVSTQKENINNKVMPTNQDTQAQEPARLKGRQKPIVEEIKNQQKSLNKVKQEIFNIIVNKLKEDRDPMVSSESVNQDARDYTHLLSDDITKMSLKDQEAEVKAIIQVCPEYFDNQKKLEELLTQVAVLQSKENYLKDEIRTKVDALNGLVSLLKHHKDKAKRDPNYLRANATDNVEEIKAEFNQQEAEVKKDQEEVKRLAADRAVLQERVDRMRML